MNLRIRGFARVVAVVLLLAVAFSGSALAADRRAGFLPSFFQKWSRGHSDDHKRDHDNSGLSAEVDALSARLSDLEGALSDLEAQNAAQADRIASLEGTIASLASRTDGLTSGLATLGTRVDGLADQSSSIADLYARTNSLSVGLTALGTRVDGLSDQSTSIAELFGRTDSLSTDLAALGARVTPLEGLPSNVTDLYGRTDLLSTDLTTLGARVTPLEGLPSNVTDLYGRTDALAGDLATVGARVDTLDNFHAQVVLDQAPGPLPLSGNIETHGGTLIVLASGTGYHLGAPRIGMTIEMDGAVIGSSGTFSNETASHKVFAPAYLVLPAVAAGMHEFALQATGSTLANLDDRFSLVVIEIPNP